MTSHANRVLISAAAAALLITAWGDTSRVPFESTVGPNPTITEPVNTLIPRVNFAEATGWPADAKPTSVAGTTVNLFATRLAHPRWVYVLPNGDVLVAESDAPPSRRERHGIKGKFMQLFMKKTGSHLPSANRITLVRDADGDGVAEAKSVFLENLFSPFGLALIGNDLYIANADSIVRVPYNAGDTRITAKPAKVTDLPGGPRRLNKTAKSS